MGEPAESLSSDETPWDLKFGDIIRIEVLHLYAFKPLLQFQAQHGLPLSISNDRLRTARPSVPFVSTVEFDPLSVDVDLFHHGILLRVCCEGDRGVAAGLPYPLESAGQEQNNSRVDAQRFYAI